MAATAFEVIECVRKEDDDAGWERGGLGGTFCSESLFTAIFILIPFAGFCSFTNYAIKCIHANKLQHFLGSSYGGATATRTIIDHRVDAE